MIPDRLPRITGEDADELMAFIKDYVDNSGCSGVVIGLSGGIDSAVVTKLSVDALGGNRVHCIFMPSRVTSEEDYRCTKELCDVWGAGYEVVDIEDVVDLFIKTICDNNVEPLERGNITARCRMTVLYHRAKSMGSIVAGTSNQSELMMGYFTKHGDGGNDIMPLADMYKTNVRQLAKIIGVPQGIIDKAPSAGLWEGQTDEDEMGISYDLLDQILFGLESEKTDKEISISVGISTQQVSTIRKRVKSMEHKRLPAARPGKII